MGKILGGCAAILAGLAVIIIVGGAAANKITKTVNDWNEAKVAIKLQKEATQQEALRLAQAERNREAEATRVAGMVTVTTIEQTQETSREQIRQTWQTLRVQLNEDGLTEREQIRADASRDTSAIFRFSRTINLALILAAAFFWSLAAYEAWQKHKRQKRRLA